MILSIDVGLKNLGLCVIDFEEKIHLWKIIDISAKTNLGVCIKLIKKFNEIEILKRVNEVVVETQHNINHKARVVAGYIISYFLTKNKIVIDYPAKFKLQVYKGDDTPDYSHLKSKYSQRKKISIFHCSKLIQTQSEDYIKFFNECKKKDDASDCFLMGVSYLRN